MNWRRNLWIFHKEEVCCCYLIILLFYILFLISFLSSFDTQNFPFKSNWNWKLGVEHRGKLNSPTDNLSCVLPFKRLNLTTDKMLNLQVIKGQHHSIWDYLTGINPEFVPNLTRLVWNRFVLPSKIKKKFN